MRSIVFCSAHVIFLLSCGPRSHVAPNKFSDPTLIKLYEFQDRRQSDSLDSYLCHSNITYKQTAFLAFASIQDTTRVKSISTGLKDDDALTRRNSAFALGQTNGDYVDEWLLNRIQIEKDSLVRYELFQALGKAAHRETLKPLVNSKDINIPWLYYRYGLRENCDSTIINSACKFLSQEYPFVCRLGAAHFFARAKINTTALAEKALIESSMNDPSANVRMASVAGLRNSSDSLAFGATAKIISRDDDYRVRVNAVRSLSSFSLEDVKDYLFLALRDSNVNVRIAAAEVIRTILTSQYSGEVLTFANTTANWRIQAILLEAVISISGEEEKERIFRNVLNIYLASKNDYQKAALLQVMPHWHQSFPVIRDALLSSNIPLIQSASASALVALDRSNGFPSNLKGSILQTYVAAIGRGDVAVIGLVTDALTDSTLGFKSLITNIEFLYQAKSKLSLPRDYESYEPLERAIAYFENRSPTSVEKKYNHPIDWRLVKTIPKDQKAVIKTTKGEITIRLFVEEAPGSVGNFVNLVLNDYYDGKFFHRVVPNFVIQGGCPRGDGWGGEHYSIRSEFSGRRYKEGSIGMASAGKDTEGVQWFITHSPTPHLDGRYTIFGEVTNGMNVVHKIEVGDEIIDIQLLNAPDSIK